MSRSNQTRSDLTRWNRTGLKRIDYVDGNAAVFLEHLRAAMIAKFTRGLPHSDEARSPDYWFDLARSADHAAPDAPRLAQLLDALDWGDLAAGLAPTGTAAPETKAARNKRLVNNYGARSEDYGIEMMRASARAAHVLAGYINAYMNEGYLATATQWASLSRLGEMVNYAPAPAASAATTVALSLKADSPALRLPTGLATSAAPPEGGAPVVFETLSDITAHPALNEARERRWNVNRETLSFSQLNTWGLDGEVAPSPGTPVLIAPGKFQEPSAKALQVAKSHVAADGKTARIALNADTSGKWRKGYTEMWFNPATSARGLTVEREGMTIVTVEKTTGLEVGAIVDFTNGRYGVHQAVINHIEDNRIGLTSATEIGEITKLRPMIPYVMPNGYFDTPIRARRGYFNDGGEVAYVGRSLTAITDHTKVTSGQLHYSNGEKGEYRFAYPGASWAGISDGDGDWITAAPLNHPPFIADALHDGQTVVPFKGKLPKGLKADDFFIARSDEDELTALRVRGFRAEKDSHYIAFNKPPKGAFDKTTFFGPMQSVIRPEDYDRNMDPILDPEDGTVTLAGLPDDARALIQTGKKVIIEDKRETGPGPVLATVQKICGEPGNGRNEVESGQIKIVLASVEFDLSAFTAGWTVFRFNTLSIGHGETKPGKTLGSGNGELERQSFPLDVKGISFVADAKAATGVRPDIDVTVDGTIWDYSDLTDPSAEGSDAYAVRPLDDDTLLIEFRRRLPTGRNNIRVSRHRVGSGARGNGIGPFALTKPKSKHKHVEAIFQPFATAGGADRESTESIRENAGAAIAANDRAVSLADFTRLVQRHASIWDARAVEVIHPGRAPEVEITVVPVDGVALDPAQTEGLTSYIRDRALPGTTARIHHFSPVPIKLQATVRADYAMVTEEDLKKEAQAALAETFALSARRLGQPMFVAEVLAALEALRGVVTATAILDLGPTVAARPGLTFTSRSGVIRAIHPLATETAFVSALTDVTITVEAAHD